MNTDAKRKEQPPRSLLLPLDSPINTYFISDLLFAALFVGDDGVRVFSIAFDSVDLGAGSLAGPVCSVVGRTGVLVTITGLLFALVFTFFFTGAFFPSLTDAGRGLVFFTTDFAGGLFFLAALFASTRVTFPAGFVTVFAPFFSALMLSPITGTATNPTAATTTHFIQFRMAAPLAKPVYKSQNPPRTRTAWELALSRWGCRPRSIARPSAALSEWVLLRN